MRSSVVFVLCPPRSGSTLLGRVLGAHPKIYAPGEFYLIPPLYHLGYFGDVVDPGIDQDLYYDPVLTRQTLRGVIEHLPGGESDYIRALRAYLDHIYGTLLAKQAKELIVDKTPRNALYADFIMKLYPQASFIVLTRHPIAVALSLHRWWKHSQTVSRGDAHPYHAVELRHMDELGGVEASGADLIGRRYGAALAAVLRRSDRHIFHVRYEDFVQNPAEIAGRLCAFLGQPYEPNMIRYGENYPASWPSGDPLTVHREIAPVPSYLDRWTQQLREEPALLTLARRLLAAFSANDMATWGYDKSRIEEELAAFATEDASG